MNTKTIHTAIAAIAMASATVSVLAETPNVGGAAASADVFALDGPTRMTPFKQADFKWAVHPRHDYSKTYVAKLFLAQAEFEPERLGRYKMRDNGKQTVYMDCEKALEAIKGMDALTLGLPKIVYLVGWQYNGHDSKYPAFFEDNRGVARPCDKDPLDSVRWLMREAKKYHTTVSLHINLFDAFEDSPLFKEYVREDVLAREKDGVRTMWKGGRLSVAKDGEILSDGSDMLIPAVWLGDGGAWVAYSEKGCRDRRWKIPAGARFSDKVKGWTVTAKGLEEFNGFKAERDAVTITLSPNEMVLIK